MRVACYVDGFNMYHALDALDKPKLKWLNLKTLASTFLRDGDELVATYYFTAVHTHDPKRCQRHKRYIDALEAVGVTVIQSKFQSVDRYCKRSDRSCPFLEEKQTDVALATTLLADALEGLIDRAILISADSDHVPVVRMVQAKRPLVQLTLAPPPNRLQNARDLGSYIQDRKEVNVGRIERCLLPRSVYKANGKLAATCPAAYGGEGKD